MFDLYELVVYTSVLTDSAFDAIQAALFANYGIQSKIHRAVFDGDSITQGIVNTAPGITSGWNIAMLATDPGSNYLPSNWHVYNMGHAGDSIDNSVNADPGNIKSRRDVALGWPNYKLSGQNVLIVQIGRNDAQTIADTAIRSAMVGYLNTTTTGVLQRGWTVRMAANIATSNPAYQTTLVSWRAMMRDSTFLTDTQTATGQTYAGKLSIIGTDLITVSAATIFSTISDSNNHSYYQNDTTHPNRTGNAAMVSGGDDPTKGLCYGLTA